jgi:SAM-dependent methyltransferase
MPTSDVLRGDSWGEDDNAYRYNAFARQYPMYRETSRDLVRLSSPARDSVVLDLACGTGVATAELLSVLGPEGKVIAADKSPAMLAVAERAVSDSRVKWVQTAAETVDRHIDEVVDAAVCNSAIWQTDLAATAAAVRKVLAVGALFAFNVGSGFLERRDDPNDLGDQLGVMRAIAARDFGWAPPDVQAPMHGRPPLSRASICRCLSDAGFQIERVEELAYEESAEARRAWLAIPIFSKSYLPGMVYQDRLRVLDKTCEHLGTGGAELSHWVAFCARAG